MASAASDAENFVFAPISRALSRSACKSSPVAPDTAATLDIAESKSAAVLTAAVPTAAIGTVTCVVKVVPTSAILSPAFSSISPASPSFTKAVREFSASRWRFCSSCSVSMISRWRASYCSCEMSPFARAVFACSAAVFRVSSFSLVAVTASARSFCFCDSSSVLVGSSFSSFSTSLSCVCVFLMFLLTPSSAFDSLVVSPPISTVIPLILFAMRFHLLREGMKKAPAGASAYNRFSYERSHIYRTILNDCFRNFIPNTFHMINLDFHFFSIMVPKCVYI